MNNIKAKMQQRIRQVPICNRKGDIVARFLISECDSHLLKYTWRLRSSGYVYRKYQGKEIRIHNEIMHPPKGYVVDHINGDTLDNTRENLRICTPQDNCKNRGIYTRNTSGVAGVNWRKDTNKWRAYIQVDGKCITLGSFTNKEDAIKSRKKAEVKYFGEFRRKN